MPAFDFFQNQNVKQPTSGLGLAVAGIAFAGILGFSMVFILWTDRENLATKKAAEEAARQEQIQKAQQESQRRQEEYRRQLEEPQGVQQPGGIQIISPEVQRIPFLGVYHTIITPELQKKYNLPVDFGAWVGRDSQGQLTQSVMFGSPADEAGLRSGDIILELDDQEITQYNTLNKIIQKYKPGDRVSLNVLRGNEKLIIEITLEGR